MGRLPTAKVDVHLFVITFIRRKTGGNAGPGASTYEDELNGVYRKIHKTLGSNNQNKDIRQIVKETLDEKLENQLTTGMNLTINPVSNNLFITL